jgi:hypothetical protein
MTLLCQDKNDPCRDVALLRLLLIVDLYTTVKMSLTDYYVKAKVKR